MVSGLAVESELQMSSATVHQGKQHRSSVKGFEAMTFVSNHHFPRHAHDQFGFGMIDFGVQLSWSALGQVEASTGDVIFNNPGEVHDGHAIDGKVRGWRKIYFDSLVVERLVEEDTRGEFEIASPVARDPLLAHHFARLFRSVTDARLDAIGREQSIVEAITCILQRNCSHPIQQRNARFPCVAKAKKRLDAAVEEPVSLAELASLSGISQFQLLRAFKRETGTTPHAYLIQRRVCVARQLLAAGATPAQAATAAGFSDQSHMTRAFLRCVGITPARYRAAVV
jgi:AraC-like DNA-binding protein